eukprot:6521819-Alexandrium_andersonii.AAC.1
MFARRSEQEFDSVSGGYMYPRTMVVVVQDCLNTVYVGESQLTGSDCQTRLTLEMLKANWPTFVGDVHLQPMVWDAPLAYGF